VLLRWVADLLLPSYPLRTAKVGGLRPALKKTQTQTGVWSKAASMAMT